MARPRTLIAAIVALAGLTLAAWGGTATLSLGAVEAERPMPSPSIQRQPPPRHSRRSVAAPAAALVVTGTEPAAGATGVDGTTPVVFSTNNSVDLASVAATVSPQVRGRWTTRPGALVFTPSGAFPPSTRVSISLSPRPRNAKGGTMANTFSTWFTTAAGSVLRLQQLLAVLGYLPLRWTPAALQPAVPPPDAADRAVFQPPAGAFTWTWNAPPTSLVAQWTPGRYTVMVRGAVMAFEADHGLAVDGLAGPQVWSALLTATDGANVATSHAGYTYALASKAVPETLTVWHNGIPIAATRANTGIPDAPTADGTFPVYERLAAQIMKGTNPDGTRYADPVAWVAYFNGGDAIHYIARSSYGYPQSLGCVEVPYQVGKEIWPFLKIGTLLTVVG